MSLSVLENRARKNREMLERYGHSGRTREDKCKYLLESFFTALTPPQRIDLDDWMDSYFYLPSESASEHGQWRTGRFPFLRKPAKKLSPTSPCKVVGYAKGAQLGFTTLMVGWKLYIADQGLGPTLYVQPTDNAIQEYSEQKLQPSIDACKRVEEKLGAKRPKHLAKTKRRMYFPGGYIALGSANSAPTLRSKSIRNLCIDEEDGCNQDVSDEGSAVYLATRRTANFPDSKICRISTPVLKDTSSIWPLMEKGTNERFLVPCPHCNSKADKYGTNFEITWDLIRYVDKQPSTAHCICPSCGEKIYEHSKTWMLDNGFWYRFNPTPKTAFIDDQKRIGILVDLEKLKYYNMPKDALEYLEATSIPDDLEELCTGHISSLYSPLGFYSWKQAVDEWIDANTRNDKSLLKTFFNTVLGLPWSDNVNDVDHRSLKGRMELFSPYGDFDVPQECLTITMGVDVQKDRLEAHVIGWGENDEAWVVDYRVFFGDTAILGDNFYMFQGHKTCWGNLAEYLNTKFKHQSGHMLPIESTLIDSRYRSQFVFQFCRSNAAKRVYAVRGTDGWGKGYIQRPTKPNNYGVYVFEAMIDELKVRWYSALRTEKPGPTYVHFSRLVDYPSQYWKGLACEELKIKRQNGTDVYYWENPPGARNEPLDTANYAYTAFLAMRLPLATRKATLATPPAIDKRKLAAEAEQKAQAENAEKQPKKVIRRRS